MKMIPYAHQWIDGNDIKEIVKVLKSDWLTQGPKGKEFEDALCEYTGAKYAVVVSSGTAALHIACVAAGIISGDEVVVSPITFIASANCILYCGGKPVFADIEEDTICIDPKEFKKKISRKTKAIIPVHFAGHPADMDEIYRIAKKGKIAIIEDACHTLGATFKGSKIGSCRYSDMTVLSFHAVKHITTGEGGIVLTNNRELFHKLSLLRSHGVTRDPQCLEINHGNWYYEMLSLGFNYRLTDMQSVLGLSQLRKNETFLARRAEIINRYNRSFRQCDCFRTPVSKPDINPSWHLYVLRLNLDTLNVSRKEIYDEYCKQGILVNVHYMPVYYHPYYRRLGYSRGACPKAEKYYEETITLPLYPNMTDREVEKVISVTLLIAGKFSK